MRGTILKVLSPTAARLVRDIPSKSNTAECDVYPCHVSQVVDVEEFVPDHEGRGVTFTHQCVNPPDVQKVCRGIPSAMNVRLV